jgi:fucose permease
VDLSALPPTAASADLAALARTRRATGALFAALGVAAGAWGVHVPSMKARYGLDEAGLAWLLLTAAAGAVAALFVAGRLVSALGVRRCVALASLGLAAGLASALHAPAWPVLGVQMLLFGAAMSVFDVAINAEGTVIESLSGRAVMGRLHALFSVGGMAGAGAASVLFTLGIPPPLQLALFGVAVPLLAAAALPRLLDAHPSEPAHGAAHRLPWRHGLVWLVGLLTFSAMVAEGAMYDWCVLYLSQELGAPPALAALGFAVFSGAMAAARWGADGMRMRWPEGRVLGAGAVLAAVAMALLLAIGQTWVALAGYVIVGVGLAAAVPILYTAATRIPGLGRADGIAAVSSIGYSGFMLGPPLIGAIARATTLSLALGVVVVACVVLALGARRVP